MISAMATLALISAPPPPQPVVDAHARFVQEVPIHYTQAQGLPSNDIRQIVVLPDGRVVAADAEGRLAVFEGGKWAAFAPAPGFAVRRLRVAGPNLWAVGDVSAARLRAGKWFPGPLGLRGPTAVTAFRGGILVAGGKQLSVPLTNVWAPMAWSHGTIHALAVLPGGRVAVGADDGLYIQRRKRAGEPCAFERVFPADARHSWSLRNVTALAAEGKRLWFGAENGAGVLDGDKWTLFSGKEGLPWNGFTCAASDGATTWFGTDRGAMSPAGDHWAYRASRRWLLADRVNAVAVDKGGVWIATPGGVTRIENRMMSLADKAAYFEQNVAERHTRMGFVVRCTMRTPGDPSTAWIPHTDNDGLYTGMYGGAACLRYGATKDPEAKRRANQCLQALKLLFDVTGIPGFPARSAVPTTWRPDPNEGFGAAANEAQKAEDPYWKLILPRWPKSADGKYWWKCDTSSDEIAGHYFFYGLYHDLVAETPEEKAQVVALVRALSDHIVDNGFRLVDHDGLPTRWGNWSPEYCLSPRGWADRGVQAVEILSFLNVAHHVTGDAKYASAAKLLRDKYSYHINAMDGRAVFPPDNVVPWDNNLAFLSYYGLLKYETDPVLRQVYRTSLDRNWLFVSRQNDPFFNFVTAAVFPDPDKPVGDSPPTDFARVLERGVRTLRGTPLSLAGWRMTNSHRLDVAQDPTPRQRKAYGWSVVTGEALPIEERSHIRINSDHFYLDNGYGDGTEYEPTFYLLPYYMGLYHGFVK